MTFGRGDDAATLEAVRRMVDVQAHRGPDGSGARLVSASAPAVALGHRRLAIIDLSERGAQPMADATDTRVLTFNGEIYNFRAVRHELEDRGRTFRSDSDSEVILQGYDEWGDDLVRRLRGMFAFALWDGRTRHLILARDRFGIKPLYVYRDRERLLFASEVRALLATGWVPARLDRAALDRYLAYQTVPTPGTLVQNVTMLPPATIARVDASGVVTERTYWDLLDAANDSAGITAEAARRDVGTALEDAMRHHLVSDVPVGLFLSGGIDSSAAVSLVRSIGVTPQTFTVAFPGTEYDEAPYARAVADALGADHTEIALDEAELLAQLPDALESVDHPSGDGINTYVVSRAVHAAGIKVVLSGLGGDELFGGYPSFVRLSRLAGWSRLWRRSPELLRSRAAAAMRAFGGESVTSRKTAALLETDGSVAEAFPVLRQMFSIEDRRRLLGRAAEDVSGQEDPYVTLLRKAANDHPNADVMALVSYAESRTYMHDVLLRDTDQMSMRHALEVRVPFLDHCLAELVIGLPGNLKVAAGRSKPLLTDSLAMPIPDMAVNRPKRGFVLPFAPWMRGALRTFCERRLGDQGLAGRGVVDPTVVRALWGAFLDHDRRTSWARLWTLVALDAWLEATGVSA